MSFINGLKRAFGFGGSDEDEEEENNEEYTAAPPTYAVPVPKPAVHHSEPPRQESEETPADSAEPDNALAGDLFDAILAVFNDAQPDFVRKCLSTDAQKQYLLDSLNDSLRSRLAAGFPAQNDECGRLREEIARLKEGSKNVDSLTNDNRKLRLSLERQKRALLDRINDLESQVVKLNEERERLYTRHPKPDNSRFEEEIARLEGELKTAQDSLAKEVEERRASEEAAEAPAISAEELESLRKELTRQTEMREQAELKSRMSDEMIKQMNSEVVASRKELEENRRQMAEVTETMLQIQEDMSKFEDVKKRLESRVRDLQSQLDEEREIDRAGRIEKLQQENATLRQTIETNLYNQANSEMRLRKEIKRLKGQIEAGQIIGMDADGEAETVPPGMEMPPNPEAPGTKRRRGRPRKARTDSALSDTDWFVAGEPPADRQPRQPRQEDPDFGYHEPPHTPGNDNEAQLTLF